MMVKVRMWPCVRLEGVFTCVPLQLQLVLSFLNSCYYTTITIDKQV